MKFRVGGILNYLTCLLYFPFSICLILGMLFDPTYTFLGRCVLYFIPIAALLALGLAIYKQRFYLLGKITFSEYDIVAFLRKPFFEHDWSDIHEIGIDVLIGKASSTFYVLMYFSTTSQPFTRGNRVDIFKSKINADYIYCLFTFKQIRKVLAVIPADKKIRWLNKDCSPDLVDTSLKDRLS